MDEGLQKCYQLCYELCYEFCYELTHIDIIWEKEPLN